MATRLPIPALRPFVALIWASEATGTPADGRVQLEHALPTGLMHIAIRLTDAPLRIRDGATTTHDVVGAVVAGARASFYVRETAELSASVGAVLRPGAANLLFGGGADELAGTHTPLGDLWGSEVVRLRERLLHTATAEGRIALLEAALAARLPRVRSMHPAVAAVIDDLPTLPSVADAVRRSGLGHRQFITQFRRTVGLAPKAYLDVLRFQRTVQALRRPGVASLADLALAAGYSDQAHFNRDFLAFSGVTPMAYRRLAPAEANHLRMEARNA